MTNNFDPKKILIIQTAFLGDVVLVTSLIEEVKKYYPKAELHVLVREGAENLLSHNPHIARVLTWTKKQKKVLNLFKTLQIIRMEKFDIIINVQRFFSSGLLTTLANAKVTVGFASNPWSTFFSHKVAHSVPMFYEGKTLHEVQRNFLLLKALKPELELPMAKSIRPKLYFDDRHQTELSKEKKNTIVIAPTSVWFTKQWPTEKWIELLQLIPESYSIFLVGSAADFTSCQQILARSKRSNISNTCGKLSLNQTALLMKTAKRVFCNDSSPQHLASAVNAPQTVVFCSTAPEFGFGPLSDDSVVMQTLNLTCRPCGIHGHASCPESHYDCAYKIESQEVFKTSMHL